LSRISGSQDLLITITSTSEEITVKDQFEGSRGIEEIQFANGTTRVLEDTLIVGTSSADVLVGADGDDIVDGKGGNDEIVGGLGDDTLQGGGGNDTFFYYRGDGTDTLEDSGGSADKIVLGEGISRDDLILQQQGDDLYIYVKGVGEQPADLSLMEDVLILKGHFVASDPIDTVEFEDGSSLAVGGLEQVFYGPVAGTQIHVKGLSLDIYNGVNSMATATDMDDWADTHTASSTASTTSLSGEASEKQMRHISGEIYLEGGQTYHFREAVDNQALLIIDAQQVLADDNWDTHTSNSFSVATSGNYSFDFYVYNLKKGGGYTLEVSTDGGATYDKLPVMYASTSSSTLGVAYEGTDGNDVLVGADGDDILNGKDGDDEIDGGVGDDKLIGDTGDDTFVFNTNFGHDTITDFVAGASSDDAVELRGISGFASYAAVLAAAADDGTDTTITIDANNTIVLQNVLVSELHSDDFRFA